LISTNFGKTFNKKINNINNISGEKSAKARMMRLFYRNVWKPLH
jgi:hypothetical protein